jgi:tetratricopeptide (TPR) repeat protein
MNVKSVFDNTVANSTNINSIRRISVVIIALFVAATIFFLPVATFAFENPKEYLLWGDTLFEKKDYKGAAEYYEKGLKIVVANNPTEVVLIGFIHISIGRCYYEVSNFNGALLHYYEALKNGKDAQTIEPDKAKMLLFRSYGNILDIYDNIGLEKQMLEITDEFIAFIKEYKREPLPDNQIPKSNVDNFLAYCYAQKGTDLDEALKLINGALKSDPNSYAMIDTKGWVLYKMGENKKALKLLKKALKLCKENETKCTVIEHHFKIVEKSGADK